MRLRNWKKLTEEAWAAATSPLPRNWGGGSATPRPPSPAFRSPSQARGKGWHRGGPSRSGRALKGPASPTPRRPLAAEPPGQGSSGHAGARPARCRAHLAGKRAGRARARGQAGSGTVHPAGRLCHRRSPLPALPPASRSAGGSSCVPLAALASPQSPGTAPLPPPGVAVGPRQTGARSLAGQHSAPGASDLRSWVFAARRK